MNEREQAVALLAQLCTAITETVAETPNGAPAGVIYAALLTVMPNLTSLQFNMLIAGLAAQGKLTRRWQMLYPPCQHDAHVRAAYDDCAQWWQANCTD